ncbi:DMT family transporter [Siminovitchia fortis]|uniref:DMT family transporter n=1 Tax=Siminovitchia fortis TaxID=254758 RepID=A0A443IVU9_9BACI|nr:DMT family transporter [Siminovitchia fortis]RWR12166.1 DMT family transporter [Siminovitchia fortis]WHY80998.1 DMT family transporter [Siminovitchia fortis]
MKWFYLLLPLAGGLAVGMQAAINGGLGKKVGSIEATFISFCIGTAALFFMVLFLGKGNILAVSEVPKYQLTGGILGAFYLAAIVFAVPRIGVSMSFLAVITGQLLISALIDHFGLFGAPKIPMDLKKVIALCLMLSAIYLFHHK